MAIDRRTMLKGLVLGGALAALPGVAGAQDGRPWTIPALREWTSRAGSFRPGLRPRIVLPPGDADRLMAGAGVLADDLRAVLGVPAEVVVRGGAPKAGDIALRLGARDDELGGEGYLLDISSAAVITANEPAGAFYGARSLVQLLIQGPTVPAGVARDWPRYPERGLMMDIGRRHFPFEWLVDRIHELAYLKMNVLHLHFTEDLGWRIESDRGIHSTDHLTKAQVRELVELAARHHITVLPEIDMPGHMAAALAAAPEYQLTDVFGQPNPGKLDFTIPAAREFAFGLIEEYLPLFPGSYWHTGADEFLNPAEFYRYPQLERYARERYGDGAVAKDGVFGFVNDINELVKGHGRTLRVWNDGLAGGQAARVDRDVVVEWWTDFSPLGDIVTPLPEEVLRDYDRIQNASWYPTYYPNLPAYMPLPHPDMEGMYEDWAVHLFRGPMYLNGDIATPYHQIDPGEQRNLGSLLHQWNDDPEKGSVGDIAAGIRPRLRVIAQKTWESAPLVPTYAEFEDVIDRIGDAPG